MSMERRPIHKKGTRNVFCPHYGRCLDHAVRAAWTGWDCRQCPQFRNEADRPELKVQSAETILFYEISLAR